MRLDRRRLLIGTGAAGGLLLAWALTPRHFDPPLEAASGEVLFDAWIRIGRDGVVTVAIPQLEMGQGVTTVLAQVVAEELGADWRQVAVEPAPVSGAYPNVALAARWSALWMPALPSLAETPDSLLALRFAQSAAFMATADGMSLASYEMPARIAAASARAMLSKAAARRWGVSWEECEAQGGFVLHEDKRLSFAELVDEAARESAPDPAVLRPEPVAEHPQEFPEGAVPRRPRLDLPAKVDGSFVFAGDVRLPNMVHAAIRHAPIGEARLARHDPAPARGLDGFQGLVAGERWLAAVAENWWAAERALQLIAPQFSVADRADSLKLGLALDEALERGDVHTLADTGDVAAALAGIEPHMVRYDVAPALHATLETASATARLSDGRLELWAAVQSPEAARAAAASAAGVSLRDTVLYVMPAGGSFDRRLEHDHVAEAAVIAREIGKPVQLTWSRWQEQVAGLPRTPAAVQLDARLHEDGSIYAWKSRLAVPASAREFGKRQFGGWDAMEARKAQGGFDPLALEGAVPPYAFANLLVEHAPAKIQLATGRMRGNAHGYTAFANECFIDELAHRAGREPLSYRIEMLGAEPRLVKCLQQASALAGWDGGKDGSGQGLACVKMGDQMLGGCIAAIVAARRDEGGIRIDKITAVADIGRIVNMDIARQQIEGGLLFGIGLALGSATPYADGLPQRGRLGQLHLPLLSDCPEMDIDFIDSSADPFDPGELGAVVLAPALANALYSVTGERLRRLPLISEDV